MYLCSKLFGYFDSVICVVCKIHGKIGHRYFFSTNLAIILTQSLPDHLHQILQWHHLLHLHFPCHYLLRQHVVSCVVQPVGQPFPAHHVPCLFFLPCHSNFPAHRFLQVLAVRNRLSQEPNQPQQTNDVKEI